MRYLSLSISSDITFDLIATETVEEAVEEYTVTHITLKIPINPLSENVGSHVSARVVFH